MGFSRRRFVEPGFLALSVLACSTDTFVGPDGSVDGSVDGSPGDVVSNDAIASCTATTAFANPTQVYFTNGGPKPIPGVARFGPDELTVYFDNSNGDLYMATRANLSATFGTPTTLATDLANPKHNPTASAVADARVLYFDAVPPISLTDASSPTAIFSNPIDTTGLSTFWLGSTVPYTSPYLATSAVMYFIVASDPISTVRRVAITNGAAGTPTTVFDVKATAVVVDHFEQEAFLAVGGSIMQSTYSGSTWSTPVPLDAPVAQSPVIPTWISPDNCRLYYLSDGTLYVVSRGS